MPIEKSELRRVMGHFATGVTVITTRDGEGKLSGLTANAVTSVSLEPPLILICVDKGADCYACFEDTGVFVVNVLAEDQEDVSRRFATKGAAKFEGVGYRLNDDGCAVIDGAVAHLDCRVVERHEGGDHTIYVARVEAADAEENAPLLFFRGGYRRIAAS